LALKSGGKSFNNFPGNQLTKSRAFETVKANSVVSTYRWTPHGQELGASGHCVHQWTDAYGSVSQKLEQFADIL